VTWQFNFRPSLGFMCLITGCCLANGLTVEFSANSRLYVSDNSVLLTNICVYKKLSPCMCPCLFLYLAVYCYNTPGSVCLWCAHCTRPSALLWTDSWCFLEILFPLLFIARFTFQTYNLFAPVKPTRILQCTFIKRTGGTSAACRYVTLTIFLI